MKQEIKVGDMVRVIRIPPSYDSGLIAIGDAGIVNYISASTKKYSVHIDGKKNPKDDREVPRRLYGKKYDFWIPDSCIELYDCWDDLFEIEEEEIARMKEIKNQKVVDLYFTRVKNELEKECAEGIKKAKENDENQKFIATLKCQLDQFTKGNEIPVSFNVSISDTRETIEKIIELTNEKNRKFNELRNFKEEIEAMLSGCQTYEQEMKVLHTYNIVHYDENYAGMHSNKTSKGD